MPAPVIMQSAGIAITLIVGVCIVYAIVQMRRAYAAQQESLPRAISAVEEFQKTQEEFKSFLRRIESDGRALQKITLQVEVAVAALRDTFSSSMRAATDRQTEAIENIRDYIDSQEERLAKLLESISETLQTIPQQPQHTPQLQSPHHVQHQQGARPQNGDHSRLRREVLSQDPELRFSVLKEWISVNELAILHRASRTWTSVNDLIANVPPYLEPEAEILNDCVLIIGTCGHSEVLAIPLQTLNSSSEFSHWFDPTLAGQSPPHRPAVLARHNGQFSLVAKGTNSATGLPAA
jgi:hypothetical protein